MPKDVTKNVVRYKIRGGEINEFEFHENQEAIAEQKSQNVANLIPGIPPEQKAESLRPAVKKAAPKSTKKAPKTTKTTKATKSRKSTKKAKTSSTRGASAKKLAARKAAKKK